MYKHTKGLSILSYITWIGFFIALFARDKDDAIVRQHLNQALILNLMETVARVIGSVGGLFHYLGEVLDACVLVLLIIGVVRAAKLSKEPLPLIGNIHMFD